MNKEARSFNTDLVSALEAIEGYTIGEIINEEITVTETDGSSEIKELTGIRASRKVDNVTIGRDVELIGEDWYLSKEYIVDIEPEKEVHPCQENPKALQP
ncbi:MAG: hypothetical protein ACRC3H_07090 [Lachnospiraceae bacterium]